MNDLVNNATKKDWEGYVREFALHLWKERPKKPIVLTVLLLSQFFVVFKNHAILKLPVIYATALVILSILVVVFWLGYMRQIGKWKPFFNEVIVGLKSVIETNSHLSDKEIELKVNEYHKCVADGKNNLAKIEEDNREVK